MRVIAKEDVKVVYAHPGASSYIRSAASKGGKARRPRERSRASAREESSVEFTGAVTLKTTLSDVKRAVKSSLRDRFRW